MNFIKNKIKNQTEITRDLAAWRLKNDTIVFTNGCFDLLHPGHLQYLEAARGLGNRLVVGLNSDESVRNLKGKTRPINDENTRAMLLAALFFVDLVVIFEQDTPQKLIEIVRPDILVKGGDYLPEKIIGADFVKKNGGEVVVLKFLEGFSTTKMIENILKKN